MLYDNKDLNEIENDYEKNAFREVIQSYYSKNYRASIVSLYSLVMLDLYNKLQYMAEEGEKKAQKELYKVNKLIEDEEKYSFVENEIIEFFKNTYSLHFNKFSKDIDYLKKTRNDCAHLKVNSSSLSIPSDYQVRMLICSMFDNVLSVKAPFIEDLFSFVKDDIEKYSESSHSILLRKIDDSVYQKYERNYFSRMTQTSILKSVGTFIKLLFISTEEQPIKNSLGIYVILRCLLRHVDENGYSALCIQDDKIQSLITRIDNDTIQVCDIRKQALFNLSCDCRWFCDEFRKNSLFLNVIESYIFDNNSFEKYYTCIFPEKVEDLWESYIVNSKKFPCENYKSRYLFLKDVQGFSDVEFIESEAKNVPAWSGFDSAKRFMSFFFEYVEEFSDEAIVRVISVYNNNDQFYNRRDGVPDIKKLIEIVEKREINIDWSLYSIFFRCINELDDE